METSIVILQPPYQTIGIFLNLKAMIRDPSYLTSCHQSVSADHQTFLLVNFKTYQIALAKSDR